MQQEPEDVRLPSGRGLRSRRMSAVRRAQEIVDGGSDTALHRAAELRGPVSVEAVALEAFRDEAFEAFADAPVETVAGGDSTPAVAKEPAITRDLMRELSDQLQALDQQRSHLAELLEQAQHRGE